MEKGVSEVYEFEEIIGEGAFSNVVLATHNETKSQFAVKIIEKERIQSQVQRERVDREIDILKSCNHPNIVKLVETFESDLEISLVMELMAGGDLFDRIMSKGVFTEEEARTAMYNILSALDYLHDRSIVHRDLKPENLLYTSKDDSALLKISDFGLSKYSTEPEWSENPCGTIAYIAPEVTNTKIYRKVVDVWSCGCILYFMLYGKPPFYSHSEEEIYELVSKGNYYFPENPTVSDGAKELIGCLLEKDPNQRYTTKQALMHFWITGRSVRPSREPSFVISPRKPPSTEETPTSTSTSTTTTTTTTTAPLTIPNIRVSLNSSIDALRGPLTPPLTSPMDVPLWRKRAAKIKSPTQLALSGTRLDLSGDEDSDGAEDGSDPTSSDGDDDDANNSFDSDSDDDKSVQNVSGSESDSNDDVDAMDMEMTYNSSTKF